MKHYFFLDAGDFILHFLSLCGSELVKNVDDVMPSRLESLLELALRTSTANADPFKDDLGLELLSFDLTSQMVRILNFQTGDGRGTRQRLTLWFFFGVILHPPKIKFLNDLICLAINLICLMSLLFLTIYHCILFYDPFLEIVDFKIEWWKQ